MIAIIGPTASGKTALAARLAHRIGGEVISADSRQVYRRMDIGTGKDLADYNVEGTTIPCHLVDIKDPGEKYNLFDYQADFLRAYKEVVSRQATPILCGGSGLYVESVLRGYRLSPAPQDSALRESLQGKPLGELAAMLESLKRANGSNMHNTTDTETAQRAVRAIEIELSIRDGGADRRDFPTISHTIIGVNVSRETRRRRISERLRHRLESGLVEEVKALLGEGVAAEDLIYYGLEYKYVTEYVIGRRTYGDMAANLETAIHQFAKRQMTWFRGMERRGLHIEWSTEDAGPGELLEWALEKTAGEWQRQKADRDGRQ